MSLLRSTALRSALTSGGRLLSSGGAAGTAVYDVVIVGGGMVGISLAAALNADPATRGLKLAVLDSAPMNDVLAEPLAAVPDARVSTVTPSSVKLFQRCGAWQYMAAPNSCAFRHMQVWDEAGTGCLRWDAQEVGLDTMGAVVENSVIQSACLRAVTSGSGSSVDLISKASIQAMKLPAYKFRLNSAAASTSGAACAAENTNLAPGSLAELHMDGGDTIRARLVVAADGARSRLRAWAGLRTFGLRYGQSGLVATVSCAPNDTAWQRFLTTGPIALLPARSLGCETEIVGGYRAGYSNIVWSTTPERAMRLQSLSPAEFGAEVNEVLQSAPQTGLAAGLSGLLPKISSRQQWQAPPRVHAWAGRAPASFPLHLQHAGKYVRPRFALVGDAAHAVHPFAGQGVNLGFGDVAQLARAVADAVKVGRDIGDIAMLEDEYEKPRMAANTTMMAGLHTLHQLFSAQLPVVAGVRNLGMNLINVARPVKNKLMSVAMGDAV